MLSFWKMDKKGYTSAVHLHMIYPLLPYIKPYTHEEIYSLRSQGPSRPVLCLYGQLWCWLICRHLIQLKAECFINVCCKISCRSNLEQVLEVVVIWVTQDMVNLSINNRNDFGQWEIKGWFKLNASNSTKFCWKCQV